MGGFAETVERNRAEDAEFLELFAKYFREDRAGGQIGEFLRDFCNCARRNERYDIHDAATYLSELADCLNPRGYVATASDIPANELWRHKDVDLSIQLGEKYRKRIVLDQDVLSDLAFRYIAQERWSSEALERVVFDALIYSEIDAFAQALRAQRLIGQDWKVQWIKQMARWAWIVLVSSICGMYVGEHGAGVGIVAFVIVYKLMQIAVATSESNVIAEGVRLVRLLGDMQTMYKSLGNLHVCPLSLKDQYRSLSSDGAVFKQGAAALLERAIERNAVRWSSRFSGG